VVQRFGGGEITFVGDRGIIKSEQIEDLNKKGFHYITAITKSQIEKLLKSGVIQMSLFDQQLAEVETHEGIRYVLRLNPIRTLEVRQTRQDKLQVVQKEVDRQNLYLAEHARAHVGVARRKVREKIARLRLSGWLSERLNGREISLTEDSAVYVTNVYDLNGRRLLWSGEGRAKETLEGFFDWFGKEQTERIEGVCCDMWQPYADVVKARAPNAILVFDKFHIVQHLSRAVDQVRRDEIREKGQAHKQLMAKTRYIWLKNPWNLTDKQQLRLTELEQLNLKINRAYLLKEAFREFWSYIRPEWARCYLDKWFWWATHSRLQPLRDFAWMLRRHQKDLLNYFSMPISNGTVEGLNNKAKVISHKAYGFRTAKNYIRNLYHCMGGLPLPHSVHTFT